MLPNEPKPGRTFFWRAALLVGGLSVFPCSRPTFPAQLLSGFRVRHTKPVYLLPTTNGWLRWSLFLWPCFLFHSIYVLKSTPFPSFWSGVSMYGPESIFLSLPFS